MHTRRIISMNTLKNSSEIKANDCFIGLGYVLTRLDGGCEVVCKRFNLPTFSQEAKALSFKTSISFLISVMVPVFMLWAIGLPFYIAMATIAAGAAGIIAGIGIHHMTVYNHMLYYCSVVRQEMVDDLAKKNMSN